MDKASRPGRIEMATDDFGVSHSAWEMARPADNRAAEFRNHRRLVMLCTPNSKTRAAERESTMILRSGLSFGVIKTSHLISDRPLAEMRWRDRTESDSARWEWPERLLRTWSAPRWSIPAG